MKYCEKCGKQLMDEAVLCPGCGCAVNSAAPSVIPKESTFKRNRKQWIIAFSVLFVLLTLVSVLLLVSDNFKDAIDRYQWYTSDFGHDAFKASEAKSALISAYILPLGACGALALASLVGDIIVIASNRKK